MSSSISRTCSNTSAAATGSVEAMRSEDVGSVGRFLTTHPIIEPEHCASIHARYRQWVRAEGVDALPERKFYARLIALGVRRFRDGRNGKMKYVMVDERRVVN